MYQFEKIKLIIWDLDETFWKGTLSEEGVQIPEVNRQLILQLTDIGIVNSICSKNDFDKVQKQMEKENLWEYFVFPSVNWEAKGNRIKQTIEDMQLRPANVLFLDDNPSNRILWWKVLKSSKSCLNRQEQQRKKILPIKG